MGTLFIISGSPESKTLFRLARRIRERECRVILVFRGEGVRFLDHPGFEEVAGFADEVYVLEEGYQPSWAWSTKSIGPRGLVELIEACERVVSWV